MLPLGCETMFVLLWFSWLWPLDATNQEHRIIRNRSVDSRRLLHFAPPWKVCQPLFSDSSANGRRFRSDDRMEVWYWSKHFRWDRLKEKHTEFGESDVAWHITGWIVGTIKVDSRFQFFLLPEMQSLKGVSRRSGGFERHEEIWAFD